MSCSALVTHETVGCEQVALFHPLSALTTLDALTRVQIAMAVEAEIEAVRAAGYTDSELADIIAHIGMNILTDVLGSSFGIATD